MEWVFQWDRMPGGTFPIDDGEPPRPNPANPGGPPIPGRRHRKAAFFQGYYRTTEEAVARELIGPEAVAAGITLHRGPHIAVKPPLVPRWRASSPSTPDLVTIAAGLPFIPIAAEGALSDAFCDPLAPPETEG